MLAEAKRVCCAPLSVICVGFFAHCPFHGKLLTIAGLKMRFLALGRPTSVTVLGKTHISSTSMPRHRSEGSLELRRWIVSGGRCVVRQADRTHMCLHPKRKRGRRRPQSLDASPERGERGSKTNSDSQPETLIDNDHPARELILVQTRELRNLKTQRHCTKTRSRCVKRWWVAYPAAHGQRPYLEQQEHLDRVHAGIAHKQRCCCKAQRALQLVAPLLRIRSSKSLDLRLR